MTLRRFVTTGSASGPFAAVPLALLALAACRRGPEGEAPAALIEEPPVKVTTVAATEQPMPRYLGLTGSLTPNEASDVAADSQGKILETKVERGSFVEKGALLALVDPRSAGLQAAEASAMSDSAKSQEKQAELDCERADRLFSSNSIAQAEYDRQKTGCAVALAGAKAARARVATALKNIGDTNVRAPFAGMVAERYVSAGEYVMPATKIARIVDIDPLRLELTVPEQAVAAIKEGLAVEFHVAAIPNHPFQGKVRYIGPSLRAASRDLVVEAVVANPDHELRPGMFATARIELGDAPAVTIPKTAVRADGALRRVFVIRDGRIEERLAKVGVEQGDLYSIEEGVSKGDQVVDPIPADLHDGVRVAAN